MKSSAATITARSAVAIPGRRGAIWRVAHPFKTHEETIAPGKTSDREFSKPRPEAKSV
jgi:hypothetical protein